MACRLSPPTYAQSRVFSARGDVSRCAAARPCLFILEVPKGVPRNGGRK